jgi:hypothetical protein
MRQIETKLTSVNYRLDTVGQAIYDLIKNYIYGLCGGDYGFRAIGLYDPAFPAVFVEPISEKAEMESTQKFRDVLSFMIYVFVIDNNPEDTLTLCTSVGSQLVKLFSNNALNDLDTTFTNKFKAYDPYWINAEMGPYQVGAYFKNPVQSSSVKYMRVGKMQLDVENVVVI